MKGQYLIFCNLHSILCLSDFLHRHDIEIKGCQRNGRAAKSLSRSQKGLRGVDLDWLLPELGLQQNHTDASLNDHFFGWSLIAHGAYLLLLFHFALLVRFTRSLKLRIVIRIDRYSHGFITLLFQLVHPRSHEFLNRSFERRLD